MIRAVAKSSFFEHGLEVTGIHEGFGGLIENKCKLLKDEGVSGILPRGGTILGANNRDDPFMFRTVSAAGEVTYEDDSRSAIDNDLNGTDISFGFDSDLQTATDALDKLHATAASHHRGRECRCLRKPIPGELPHVDGV